MRCIIAMLLLVSFLAAGEAGQSDKTEADLLTYCLLPVSEPDPKRLYSADDKPDLVDWTPSLDSWEPFYRLALFRDLAILADTGRIPAEPSEKAANPGPVTDRLTKAIDRAKLVIDVRARDGLISEPVARRVLTVLTRHRTSPFASLNIWTRQGSAFPDALPAINVQNGFADYDDAVKWMATAPFDGKRTPVDQAKALALFGTEETSDAAPRIAWAPPGRPAIAVDVSWFTVDGKAVLTSPQVRQRSGVITYHAARIAFSWTAAHVARIKAAQ